MNSYAIWNLQLLMLSDCGTINRVSGQIRRDGRPYLRCQHPLRVAHELGGQWTGISRVNDLLSRRLRRAERRGDRLEPCLTLVVAGDADPLTSLGRVCDLRRERSQVSIAVCNGAGHFPMLEAPEALSVALRRFVGGLRRRTHVSDGTWAYRPDCVWTDPEAPEMADAGQAREAMEQLARDW